MALRLGGTVAELKVRMSTAEYRRWQVFYQTQPFDDLYLHYRPAALVSAIMSDGDIAAKMDWLLPKPKPAGDDVDASVYAAFGHPIPEQTTS